MNEEAIREAAQERLAVAELAAVLDVPIAAITGAEDLATSRPTWRARLLVAAILVMGLSVAGGVAWLNANDQRAAAQQPIAFDPIHPWYEEYLPQRGQAFVVRKPEDFANIPSPNHDVVIPSKADHAALIDEIPRQPNLRFLTIVLPPDGSLGEAQWQTLGATPQLEALCLTGRPRILAAHLRELRHAPRLRSLMICGMQNELTADCTQAIQEFPHLRSLTLASMPLTSAGLQSLAGLPHLNTLVLLQTPLNEQLVAALGKLTQLRALAFNGCFSDSQPSARHLLSLAKLNKLQMLDLGDCQMRDDLLAALPKRIESLAFAGMQHVTTKGIGSLSRLTKLRSLSLRGEIPSGLQAELAEQLGTLPLENFETFVGQPADAIWSALLNNKKLRGLTLDARKAPDLARCSELQNLEQLTLACHELPTSQDLQPLAAMQTLRRVRIHQQPYKSSVDHQQSRSERIADLQTTLGDKIQLVIE